MFTVQNIREIEDRIYDHVVFVNSLISDRKDCPPVYLGELQGMIMILNCMAESQSDSVRYWIGFENGSFTFGYTVVDDDGSDLDFYLIG